MRRQRSESVSSSSSQMADYFRLLEQDTAPSRCSPSRTSSDELRGLVLQQQHELAETLNRISRGGAAASESEVRDILASTRRQQVARSNTSKFAVPPATDEAISKLARSRVLPFQRKMFQNDTTECGICQDRLINGFAVARLPCGHIYHFNCCTQWLKTNHTCPECRYELPTNNAKVERKREQRMKSRKVVSCDCHPSAMHECFFRNPSKSLFEQCCVEISSDSDESGSVANSDASTCEGADPEDHLRFH